MTSPSIKDGETVWWCQSESDSDKPYVVDLEGRGGRGSCDCYNYIFNSHKKDFKDCKHLRVVFRAFADLKLKQIMTARGTLNQEDGP